MGVHLSAGRIGGPEGRGVGMSPTRCLLSRSSQLCGNQPGKQISDTAQAWDRREQRGPEGAGEASPKMGSSTESWETSCERLGCPRQKEQREQGPWGVKQAVCSRSCR